MAKKKTGAAPMPEDVKSPEQDLIATIKRYPEPDPTKEGLLFVVNDADGKSFILWTDNEQGLGIVRAERTELVEAIQGHLHGHAEAGTSLVQALPALLAEVQRRGGSAEIFQGLLSELAAEHQDKVS